jgi:hypothetical protein
MNFCFFNVIYHTRRQTWENTEGGYFLSLLDSNFVRALRFDRTAEQIAGMADISIDEVNAILNAHLLDNN